MCGIIGILGRGPVAEQLVDSLKRLEYRGYDSAGVATLEGDTLERRRAEGKLNNLEARLREDPLTGFTGIGHTRWATHGKPNESNAHPHATENVAVVHNGIIENFRELRAELEKQGAKFASETDTEVVAHLVNSYLLKGFSPQEAVKASLPRLRGAFALAFLFRGHEDLLIGARKGSPLAIGHGDGEMYLGSDAIALAPFTDMISYLDDGDWVVLTREVGVIYDVNGAVVNRDVLKSGASAFLVDKANYRHFMAKEIHEQPEVVGHTLARYVDMASGARQSADQAAVRLQQHPAHLDHGLRHGELCRLCREILVRAVRAHSGRGRRRLRIPLPRGAACARAISPSSSRSPARPPTRWPRCATPRRKARTRSRSSTCRPRRLRAKARPCCRRSPVPRSASPRPRPSPASSWCWRRLRSRPARRAANCPTTTRPSWCMG